MFRIHLCRWALYREQPAAFRTAQHICREHDTSRMVLERHVASKSLELMRVAAACIFLEAVRGLVARRPARKRLGLRPLLINAGKDGVRLSVSQRRLI